VTALLLDQNLSPKLVQRLAKGYPGSVHVSEAGLATALDRAVWAYALPHSLVLVTKDADFVDIGLLSRDGPKVIWIRRGNCSTADIERILRENRTAIDAFVESADDRTLTLY